MSKIKNLSIIDKELCIDGTISCKGRLIVKGMVRGQLNAESVVIAEEGEVHSEAQVTSITIGGLFEGEISASEDLTILSTGTCSGKVICKDLVVESGGILNAEVTCKNVTNLKENTSGSKVIDLSD